MINGHDESKLTAFALGELEGEEQLRMARHIEANPDARREVEEIQALAGMLTEEFAKVPPVALADAQRQQLEQRLSTPMRVVGGTARGGRWRWMALAAAACLGIGIWAGFHLLDGRSGPYAISTTDHPQKMAAEPGAKSIFDLSNAAAGPERDAIAAQQFQLSQEKGAGTAAQAIAPGALNLNSAPELEPIHITLPKPSYVGTPKNLPSGVVRPGDWNAQFSRSPWPQGTGPQVPTAGYVALPQPEIIEVPPGHFRPAFNTESYDRIVDNAFLKVLDHPLSTFSIDVDTASYSNVRRFITAGRLPPKDAVRIEELINYFSYAYPAPTGPHPFSVNVEVSAAPWNERHRLARIALKGKEIPFDQRPPANLVFLIDVSGSMAPANRLPLLKQAMKLMVRNLSEADRVAIVVYAGSSGLVLPSTSCERKDLILAALDRLEAGGSTNGGEGIQLAYQVAASTFIPKGTNRVILATDGDFNVGITNQGSLVRLIEEKAKTGVFLSILGFGMGNLKDSTMEQLAGKGNGNYAYIDTLQEAHKVLVEQMAGTLITIAKDVKLQLEFNPAQVSAYRLIGYENRVLAKEDFNDDRKDAGDIGAGHTVTALYEIVPAGVPLNGPGVDALKYQKPQPQPRRADVHSDELMTVKLRYKQPDGERSTLMEVPVTDGGRGLADASDDFRFAAAVAAYGMILRDSPYKSSATLGAALELAQTALGRDESGYRREFISLVQRTREIVGDTGLNGGPRR